MLPTASWLIGIVAYPAGGWAAALLETEGGQGAHGVQCVDSLSLPPPQPGGAALPARDAADGAEAREAAGARAAAIARELWERVGVGPRDIAAIALAAGPSRDRDDALSCAADAVSTTRLAASTGQLVLSDFSFAGGVPPRYLAALTDWFFLHHPLRGRLVLHLDDQIRLTWIPHGSAGDSVQTSPSIPGMEWLGMVARQFSAGRWCEDAGGSLAVQGRLIEPLMTQWSAHPVFARGVTGLRADDAVEFFRAAVASASPPDCKLCDLLCTATHLIATHASATGEALVGNRRLPFDVIVTGAGSRNGFLVRLLQSQFATARVLDSSLLGLPPLANDAAGAALLAAWLLDGRLRNSVAPFLPPITSCWTIPPGRWGEFGATRLRHAG